MRYISWLLSFLLHATIIVVLLQTIHLEPFDLREIMEVELTDVEPPEEIIQPMPLLPPPAPEPQQVAEPIPADAVVAPAPLEMDKTIVLDDSPPPPPEPAAPEPEPAPEIEPDVVEISPVKVEKAEEEPKPNRIIVRKDDTIVHRGHEARFGRSMMADYYSYEATEFSGQFTTRDDRTISIIDARNTKYGRFLIYDSKNKTLRRLKQVFKYVFTIGPSLYEDEPVTGSVTFLAKNDRIERFILQTDDDRLAHYPRKVHVREEEKTFPTPNGERVAYLSLPPFGEDHAGVVFIHGNRCVDPGLIQGFTRALSGRKLASLAFAARGCEDESGEPEAESLLVQDTVSAMDYFASLSQLRSGKAGLWGNGPGVPVVLEAAAHPGKRHPAFAVCLLDDALSPDAVPDKKTLAALDVPVLWLITGHEPAKWKPLIAQLEDLRDNGKRPFSIVVAPLKASKDVLQAAGAQVGWVENVTEDHARLAVSWIRALE
ncbi:hypothetical protein [Pseudodesulfovibrio sp. zrk46]|uniref:dienelactone hydrolase family protein n=1 Tax=Pseudodesulfovibrio sp. zrk46 TaxID=2725288 RepID=UPI00144915E0|nr:hypothetical protein [Pseudodesulfovibrio sp. zrk46]QJB55684.1 hypothetical protein HFN16_04400 [Pseudodesulfovibrio sp. zrk46]